MLETSELHEVALYVAGQEPMPGDVVLRSLANNNTELKILVQAPLIEGEPVLMSEVKASLVKACGGNTMQPLSSGQVIRTLGSMSRNFIKVEDSPRGKTVTQTREGRGLSAALGGHLLNLAKETNVSLRSLVGENCPPRLLRGKSAKGSIETRVKVLATMWELARAEWQPAADLQEAFGEIDMPERLARSHLDRLRKAGIVERREPNHKLRSERIVHGFLYRIKQENDHVPPTQIVERYLSIVLLSSIVDLGYIAEGLDYLETISHNSTYVPYLLKRSFSNSGHEGKHPKISR